MRTLLPATQLSRIQGQVAPEIANVAAWKNCETLKLANLRRKCVLLDFWGYWCAPCISRMPELFALHDKYHDQGLEIVGVHIDLGEKENEPVDSASKLDQRLTYARATFWNGRDIPLPVALVSGEPVANGDDFKEKARCAAAARLRHPALSEPRVD